MTKRSEHSRVPLLVLLAAHHKGLHEGIPQRGSGIGGDVFGSAELEGAVFDGFGFTRSEAAGINVHGHHVVATLDEPGTQNEVSSPPEKASTVGAVDRESFTDAPAWVRADGPSRPFAREADFQLSE